VNEKTREEPSTTPSTTPVETFVANHRELLRYVEAGVA
jgi:hypothetical protein